MLDRFHVPSADEVRVDAEELRLAVHNIFLAHGVPEADAEQGADVLVYADLRGVETHGVSNMLRRYVAEYQSGKLNPTPALNVVQESPSSATVDGDRGLGIIQVPKAMRIAIERARTQGVGIVTVRNVGHTGAIGYYANMAADVDMVGLSMTASGSQVVPTFAGESRMGTNPIAVSAPTGKTPRLLFDAAMSSIAGNKITLAHRVGSLLLPGWIAGDDGAPIMEETPAPDRMAGQIPQLPLGSTRELSSHKGFGLALMVEVLATMLSGALPRMLDPEGGSRHFLAAFDIAAFTDLDGFKQRIDQMLQHLLDTPPAAGHERVIYPGVSEAEELVARTERGIPLHREVIAWFDQTTDELNLPRLETLTRPVG